MFWNRFWLKSNIVRVEDLVRFPSSALELSRRGKFDRSKNGANHGHIMMFTPIRINEEFDHAFADNPVLYLSDEVQKTNQIQPATPLLYSRRFSSNHTPAQ